MIYPGIKIYSDGADLETIVSMDQGGLVDGFTTNPTLMAKAGITDYVGFAKSVLAEVTTKSISFEVFSDDLEQMYAQAHTLNELGQNVWVKVPVTNTQGVPTYDLVNRLACDGIKVNVTAIFTSDQVRRVVAALESGVPAIVSIFAGRIANAGVDPEPLMREASSLCRGLKGQRLCGQALRSLQYRAGTTSGTDIITLTPALITAAADLGRDLDVSFHYLQLRCFMMTQRRQDLISEHIFRDGVRFHLSENSSFNTNARSKGGRAA